MEYDPASPTDEPEEFFPQLDLSSIPLPESKANPVYLSTCVTDIPLPPTNLKTSDIPLPGLPCVERRHGQKDPPVITQEESYIEISQPVQPQPPPEKVEKIEIDSTPGPLKFTLKGSSKHVAEENVNERTGVFESSKVSKPLEQRTLPKLQAMMKRSKPSQLRVGVLPSKTKLPVTEVKTELFLPTKEPEDGTGLASAVEAAASVASAINSAGMQYSSSVSDQSEVLMNAVRDLNALNSFAHMASAGNVAHLSVEASRGDNVSSISNLSSNTTNIPNLMSLTIQPVPGTSNNAVTSDPSALLRQTKLNMANMQFVNPQKLRSAQMIATPLIANPAIAAKPHHSEDVPKSRDSKRRSRSRSRRRSHSGRRSSPSRRSRRHHSSSSGESSPSRRSRGYQRRSRSRQESEERYERSRRLSGGRERDKRDRDRWREDSSEFQRRRRNDRIYRERRNSRTSPRYSDRSRRRSDSRDRDYRGRHSRKSPEERSKENRRASSRESKGTSKVRRSDSRDKNKRSDSPNHERRADSRSRDRKSEVKSKEQKAVSKEREKRVDVHVRERTSTKDEKRSSRNDHKDKTSSNRKRSPSRTDRTDIECKRGKEEPNVSTFKPSNIKSGFNKVCRGSSDDHKRDTTNGSDNHTEESSDNESSRSETSYASQQQEPAPETAVRSRSSSSSSDKSSESSLRNSKASGSKGDDSPTTDPTATSLSACESGFMNASLHTKKAGVGIDSSPVCLTPKQAEEDAMDLVSDIETNSPDVSSISTLVCSPFREALPSDGSSGQFAANDCLPVAQPHPRPSFGTSNNSSEHFTSNGYLPDPEPTVETSNSIQGSLVVSSYDGFLGSSVNEESSSQTARTEGKYDLRERKTKENRTINGELDYLLSVIFADSSCLEHSPKVFDAYPDAPKPEYHHIFINEYSKIERPLNKSSIQSDADSLAKASLLGSAAALAHNEMRRWVCDCTPPSLEELQAGIFPCGVGCINRALNIECGPSCPAGEFCRNRQFQKRLYAPTEPFYSGPGKGWGLRTTAPVKKHSFIIEYVGEVIDFVEFRRRIRRYERLGRAHHYFMSLESDRFIDSGSKGNWARFVNHSCEPNCVTQKWSVNGDIRIGFFAKEDIEAGEELTIDYQFVQYGMSEQKCYCGTPSCSGIMGSTSKSLQDKVRLKDTSVVERRVAQLLQKDSFERAEDITLVLQVMVQECLTRYTRFELLKRLEATQSNACLKLFRQYNGLDMLAAFMCDSDANDWELKRQILICLAHIPVSEQKQVQSDSRLMDIVRQWTIDPRFCRPRVSSPNEVSEQKVLPSGDELIQKDPPNGSCTPQDPEDEALLPSASSNSVLSQKTEDPVPDGSASPLPPIVGNVYDSCPSTPGSTQSSVSSRVTTRSSSLAPDPQSDGLKIANPSVVSTDRISEPTSPYVDVETGEVEPRTSSNAEMDPKASASTLLSEEDWICELKGLATMLMEKWSKLPKENYRIPRTERQETENELRVSGQSGSSLVSWGHDDEPNDSINSWGQQNLAPNTSRPKRSSKNDSTTAKTANMHKLSKLERRKIFEAQVSAAESKKDEPVPDPPPQATVDNGSTDEVETLRQLLLRSLLDELKKSGLNKSESGVGGSEGERTAVLMNTLLQTLPHFLSKLTANNDIEAISRLCQKLKNRIACSAEDLPAGWKSTVDNNGRVYYYNPSTKTVQWEKPGIENEKSKEETIPPKCVEKPPVPSINKDERKRMEKEFTENVGKYILRLLRPYRLPNCMTGRLESNEDLIHVTRKMTHSFVSKEILRCRLSSPPVLTDQLQDRIRTKVTQYMTSRGTVYKRRNKPDSSQPAISSSNTQPST